jgi:hypothetical protein
VDYERERKIVRNVASVAELAKSRFTHARIDGEYRTFFKKRRVRRRPGKPGRNKAVASHRTPYEF